MPKKKADVQYFEAIGRRKSASSRVRLYLVEKNAEANIGDSLKIKRNEMVVNKEPISSYFSGNVNKELYLSPLKLTGNEDRYAISVQVRGGGKQGQLDALVLGLSRALEKADAALRPTLKKEGLLTRDARIKERRKVGTGGKARRQKQSPKR